MHFVDGDENLCAVTGIRFSPPCVLSEQTRAMEVLRGRTGDEQQESRQAEWEEGGGGQVA